MALIASIAAPQPGAQNARLATRLEDVFGVENYPEAARNAGEEGRVRVELKSGPDGIVSACSIADSSGSAILDAETCRIALAKIRYVPARDAQGRAVSSVSRIWVNWQLPGTQLQPEQSTMRFGLDKGRVISCMAVEPKATLPLSVCEQRIPVSVFARAFGERFTDITRLDMIQILRPGSGPIVRPAVPGMRVTMGEAVFTLGADGRATGCTERSDIRTRLAKMCTTRQLAQSHYTGADSFVAAVDLVADVPPPKPVK